MDDHGATSLSTPIDLRRLAGATSSSAVGAARLQLVWLLAAVAPGFFSGIAAVFVLLPILARLVAGDGRMSWPLVPLDLFGFYSIGG